MATKANTISRLMDLLMFHSWFEMCGRHWPPDKEISFRYHIQPRWSSVLFANNLFDSPVRHEPDDCDQNIERTRQPPFHKRQRDRARIEQQRNLTFQIIPQSEC